jgi:hypothetical protein
MKSIIKYATGIKVKRSMAKIKPKSRLSAEVIKIEIPHTNNNI